ncbi:hypothetical protein CLV41_105158 [Roseibium marinum]|uniref:Uncharacterized protein n=1 Tax=Roseibium marinum TaxID=281252 RepID=A0A2S3UTT6_9HYPH|nr:hypothetical protein CLV41_105158 [Roseibium marinum]
MFRTINEERGARRAADLRRRFRHVSEASLRRASVSRSHRDQPYFGRKPAATAPVWRDVKVRRSHFDNFLIWSVLAVIVTVAGYVVF